jgi:hypothetical protein
MEYVLANPIPVEVEVLFCPMFCDFRKSIAFLEGSQALPICPGKRNI